MVFVKFGQVMQHMCVVIPHVTKVVLFLAKRSYKPWTKDEEEVLYRHFSACLKTETCPGMSYRLISLY